MRKARLLLIFLIALLTPVSVASADFRQGEQCLIGADTTITGNLYTVCQNLTINGTVGGDVVTLAGDVTVNGTVQGDITAVAGSVIVNGTVGGDVRALAARLLIAPSARLTAERGDVAGIGLSADLLAPIPGDVLFTGYQAVIGNTVGGSARFDGAALTVNGQIAGDANIRIASDTFRPPDLPALGVAIGEPGMTFGQTARVKGNLWYEASAPINVQPGAVGGEVRFFQGTSNGEIGVAPFTEVAANYAGRILHDLLALMAIGLVGLLIAQPGLRDTTWQLKAKALPSLGYGVAAVALSFPIMIALVLVSGLIVGLIHLVTLGELTLPVGALLLILNITVIGGYWFVVAFLARLVVCYWFGQWLGRRLLLADRVTTLVISLLLGVLAYAVVGNLPLGIGAIFTAVTMFMGLGAIFLTVRTRLLRRPVPPTPAIRATPVSALLPGMSHTYLAPPEDVEATPGMDNLPEGFTWFDE